MIELQVHHILRMAKASAWFRVAAVLLTGVVLLAATDTFTRAGVEVAVLFATALFYAVAVLVVEPYRYSRAFVWESLSALIDWVFITLGVVATGGERSDLYVLYFLFVLSIALRVGLREVILAGTATALGYFLVIWATTTPSAPVLHTAATRMSYLVLFAVGSAVLAREADRQLRARIREEAQRLALQEVTATVSHDLKNPLTAVTGLVEMLLDATPEDNGSNARELLQRINANAQQMSNLVSNLVDAEVLERGQQSFRPAPTDLNTLVRRVVDAQAHHAEIKRIGLVLDLSTRLSAVMIDAAMIERVVANLLSNALKFTPATGAVRITTRPRHGRACLEVWNSGSQVPAALQPVLFEKFVREKDSTGVGLGLYICKSIVELHRGRIAVRNAADRGVVFVVDLPLVALPSTREQPTPAGPHLAHPRRVRALG